MKLRYTAMTAAALVLTAAANAQMSNSYTQANPFSVRIGAAWLTDENARKGVGNTGLHAGIGYDLPFKGLFNAPGERGSIDFDYNGWWRNGNKFNTYALSYVERVPFTTSTTNNVNEPMFYGGLGVGVVHDTASGGGSTSRTTVGGKALLGVSFQRRYAVELQYDFRAKFFGVSPNAFSLSLGYHF